MLQINIMHQIPVNTNRDTQSDSYSLLITIHYTYELIQLEKATCSSWRTEWVVPADDFNDIPGRVSKFSFLVIFEDQELATSLDLRSEQSCWNSLKDIRPLIEVLFLLFSLSMSTRTSHWGIFSPTISNAAFSSLTSRNPLPSRSICKYAKSSEKQNSKSQSASPSEKPGLNPSYQIRTIRQQNSLIFRS